MILYELLTDRRPFRGASTAEIFEEVETRDPKPLRRSSRRFPSELERICLKCLQKRQTDRYASAAELLDDLEAWLRKSSGASSTPSAGRRAGPVRQPATPQPGSPGADSTAVLSDTKSDKTTTAAYCAQGSAFVRRARRGLLPGVVARCTRS